MKKTKVDIGKTLPELTFRKALQDLCEQDIGPEEMDAAQMSKAMRQIADNIAVRPEFEKWWNKYVGQRKKKLTKGNK